ncbi:RNA methyltransferase [Sulfurovum sp. XTW-4]|uniref:tRNA (guanosine(18)-2'-O)-methyltransferase n=1 Tax=Sulfurovum xiamenensis TaxID=3019066 RepID=A0ABT7QQC6_9BACT|nr:RNA methyltransferase [Sulfurovum xiamenensis]MDM5263310.1 RNA methyltransferase [Sulfurovum xiamenensis]
MLNEKRITRIDDVLSKKQPDLQVMLDNLYSSQNLSAIIRSADAVGVLDVYYATKEDASVRIHKTITQGAHRWTHRYRMHNDHKVSFIKEKKTQGFQVVVTHLEEQAVSFREVDYTKPTLLVMGNEKEGVSSEIVKLADEIIIIPMQGMVQSLNVSVATGLILYEAQRQRELSGRYNASSLTSEKKEEIKAAWVYRDTIARKSKGQIPIILEEKIIGF